jgi:ATP-dependent Lon protease
MKLSDHILTKLIREYCRESGVRSLEHQIEAIGRKMALGIAKNSPVKVNTDKALEKLIGLPHFTTDRFYETTPVGVTMGLAWTEMGGATLYIETTRTPTKSETHSILTTGKMGETMKESTAIAYIYAKNFLKKHQPDNLYFKENSIHLHVPEGATPKDGPSAGVTMVTSLLSLAMGVPVKKDFAMTGEISLTGKVMEIGGVKEKAIAAKRSGVKQIIFPKNNQRNWGELEKEITKGLTPHFVDYYTEIWDLVFSKVDRQQSTPQQQPLQPPQKPPPLQQPQQ